MSVKPTESTSLVQIKPDKSSGNALSNISPDENTSETSSVTPTSPVQPSGRVTQETDTDNTLVKAGQKEEPEPDVEQVESAVEKLNSFMDSMQRDLEFAVDDDLGRTIVTVRDSSTQEVVRQLPSETALKLAKVLQDSNEVPSAEGSKGQLLDVKT